LWRAGIHEILECHGWNEEMLRDRNEQLTRIEMFLASFNTVSCLHAFPHVVTLQLLGQDVHSLDGLKCCTKLEHLWVVEAGLASMDGLQHLASLNHLYLYNNRIARISHIAHLTGLQVLWLADNRITALEGLESLASLRELNIASNPLARVGAALARLPCLQVLNLSATAVASFREASALASAAALRELHFDDPNWGSAPLSRLANYQTVMLAQLPQLEVLDYLPVTDAHRELAQAAAVKKGIFYGMRAKALAAQADAAARAARHAANKALEAWYTELKPAVQQRIALEFASSGAGCGDAASKAVEAKVEALRRAEDAVHADAAALLVRPPGGIRCCTCCSKQLFDA
jgi:Leucine-rich repeat